MPSCPATPTKQIQELVSGAVKQGLSTGGMFTVYDPKTGEELTPDKRGEILGNLAPSSIDYDVIPGHEGISIIGRPIIGKDKAGGEQLGDYVISTLGGQKVERKIMDDNIFMANYNSSLRIREKALSDKEEDGKATTFALGYKLPAKGVVDLPKSYTDVAAIKRDYTTTNLELRNDINNTSLTEAEKQLVSGFLINKNNYSLDEILKFNKWSDPAVVTLLAMKRDAKKAIYESTVMIDEAAKNYAGLPKKLVGVRMLL